MSEPVENVEEIPAETQESTAVESTEGLSSDPSVQQEAGEGEPQTGSDETQKGDGGAFKAGRFYEERQERKLDKTQSALKEAQEQLAAVTRQTEAAQAALPADAKPVLGPMPQNSDPDVDWDDAKLSQKMDAWVNQRIENGFTDMEAKRVAREVNATETQRITDFQSREQEYIRENPEYLELWRQSKDVLPPSHAVKMAIVASPNGPAVYHALMSDPDEFMRINALPDVAAVMAFATKEAGMSLPTGTKKNPAPNKQNLPKPMSENIGGGGSSASDSDTNIHEKGISTEEYARREGNLYRQNHPA